MSTEGGAAREARAGRAAAESAARSPRPQGLPSPRYRYSSFVELSAGCGAGHMYMSEGGSFMA